jgi:opacity protein-like surface antigen
MNGIRCLSAAAILALASAPAFAQPSRFSIAVHGGGAGQEENNLRPGFETGFGFDLRLGKGLVLAVDASSWKSRSRASYRKLYDGVLTVAPVSASLRFELRPNAYFIPYVLGGGSFVWTRYRIGPAASSREVAINQSVENGAAVHFGFGARVPMSRRWSFFCEGVYFIRSAPGRTVFRDAAGGETTDDIRVNLHIVLMKFGFRFHL